MTSLTKMAKNEKIRDPSVEITDHIRACGRQNAGFYQNKHNYSRKWTAFYDSIS